MDTNKQNNLWEHDSTIFAYELVWRAAQSALQVASIKSPKIRKHHLALQSFLCGFIAFEGFTNFMGEEIAPDIWMDERNFFSRGKFRGIIGKVNFLVDRFQNGKSIKQSEHYGAFLELKKMRDFLAHLKPERMKEYSVGGSPSFSSKLDQIQTPRAAGKALKHLKALAELMRIEALIILKEEYQLSHLHFPAFRGPLGSASGRGPVV